MNVNPPMSVLSKHSASENLNRYLSDICSPHPQIPARNCFSVSETWFLFTLNCPKNNACLRFIAILLSAFATLYHFLFSSNIEYIILSANRKEHLFYDILTIDSKNLFHDAIPIQL